MLLLFTINNRTLNNHRSFINSTQFTDYHKPRFFTLIQSSRHKIDEVEVAKALIRNVDFSINSTLYGFEFKNRIIKPNKITYGRNRNFSDLSKENYITEHQPNMLGFALVVQKDNEV
jgi:hypothetical protein